jgi:uncharacterized protein
MKIAELAFTATPAKEQVSAVLIRPDDASWLMVLGHGAGAGMRHRGMEATAQALADAGIATFRYQFPYMEAGGGGPDPRPVLLATVRSAVEAASRAAPDLPLLAGGRSMGGRMTSLAASEEALPGVRGIVFFAFPLHPAGKPGTDRAEHLSKVRLPMLFLQGTRDTLADLGLLRPVVAKLGAAGTLHVAETADHSFHVLKSSGTTDQRLMRDLAERVAGWASELP